MENQPQRDTGPELKIRSILHKMGFRYRVDYQPIKSIRRRADVAFLGARVAVFVDGCFWHSCRYHGTTPKVNTHYWLPKLERVTRRDQKVKSLLRKAGGAVIRVWEHVEIEKAADLVVRALMLR